MSTQIRGEQLRSVIIPQVSSDPVSPSLGQTWVLKTDNTGQALGLLLALTITMSPTYQMSYKSDGAIIRTALA